MKRQRPDGSYEDLGPGGGHPRGMEIVRKAEEPLVGNDPRQETTLVHPGGRKRGPLPADADHEDGASWRLNR